MAGLTTIYVLSGALVLLSSFVFGMEDDVISRNLRLRRIAFEAYLTAREGHIPEGTTIVFPYYHLNEGLGYNRYTGKFTAPIGGVYKFSAQVCHVPNRDMVAAIMKGRVRLTAITTFEAKQSTCGSMNTIVRLQKGDVVSVVSVWKNNYILANGHRWNSFSGHFLYK